MKMIRTISMLGGTAAVRLLPVDHILDCEAIEPEERRRMIRDGEAEWRTNLDKPRGEGDFLARIPATERAS